jgi:hypothetical protein
MRLNSHLPRPHNLQTLPLPFKSPRRSPRLPGIVARPAASRCTVKFVAGFLKDLKIAHGTWDKCTGHSGDARSSHANTTGNALKKSRLTLPMSTVTNFAHWSQKEYAPCMGRMFSSPWMLTISKDRTVRTYYFPFLFWPQGHRSENSNNLNI